MEEHCMSLLRPGAHKQYTVNTLPYDPVGLLYFEVCKYLQLEWATDRTLTTKHATDILTSLKLFNKHHSPNHISLLFICERQTARNVRKGENPKKADKRRNWNLPLGRQSKQASMVNMATCGMLIICWYKSLHIYMGYWSLTDNAYTMNRSVLATTGIPGVTHTRAKM